MWLISKLSTQVRNSCKERVSSFRLCKLPRPLAALFWAPHRLACCSSVVAWSVPSAGPVLQHAPTKSLTILVSGVVTDLTCL